MAVGAIVTEAFVYELDWDKDWSQGHFELSWFSHAGKS
jgi:hypothetical protein